MTTVSVKTDSLRLPLTGGDYFVFALDRHLRCAGFQGNICRLVLRLDGRLRVESLQNALHRCASLDTLANLCIKRQLPFALPYWFDKYRKCPLTITEHRTTLARNDAFDPCELAAAQPLDPRKSPAVAFDIVQYADEKTDLILTWHHTLMDARGAEALLMQIANPDANIVLFDRDSCTCNYLPQNVHLNALPKMVQKIVFARKSLVFIEQVHRHPLATLTGSNGRQCLNEHSYIPISFSEEETITIDAYSERLDARFYTSLFILSAVVRAFHIIRCHRGGNAEAYAVPVPLDVRKRGAFGPIVSNHVTFLFYRIEPDDAANMETLVAVLKQQMVSQLRLNYHQSFSTAMSMFRHLPLGLYAAILRRPSRGAMASFFFSHTGENLNNAEEFLSVPIVDLWHLAPVPVPPGAAVISGHFHNRLWLVLSFAEGYFTDAEQQLFKNAVRTELLGERQK